MGGRAKLVHQDPVLGPLLFIVVLEALSRESREGLTMKLLHADDLVLIAGTKELLLEKVRNWKNGMEKKGMQVNAEKTKVVWCRLTIYVVFAGRELAKTQSFVWSVIGGFTRDVVAFQEC